MRIFPLSSGLTPKVISCSSVAGLPAEVPRRAGGGHAEAGRTGEEDRPSRGRLQTLLGGTQGGTPGTHNAQRREAGDTEAPRVVRPARARLAAD